MPLVKAKIITVATATKPESSFNVLFNPTEYTVASRNNFVEYSDSSVTLQRFSDRAPETLDMTLMFDSYELKKSVKEYVEQFLKLMYSYSKEPTVCKFIWGDFCFRGILKSADQDYILFDSSGYPVRASVKVQFVEYNSSKCAGDNTVDPASDLQSGKKGEGSDPEAWKDTARTKGVDNPRMV